tara:strand:- start:49 stop:621 length:573 start_codon:yes stop_codon:yes gene_type:complete
MNNKREKWTDEDTNELLRLRKAGAPYKEIAKQINRSAHACTQQYSKVKDAVPNRKVKELHKHMKQLGDPKQKPYNFINQQPAPVPSTERNNKAWTGKEDRLLKSMVKHKATMLQLMTALKRTEKAIDSRIRTLSKKTRTYPKPAKVESTTDIGIENFIGFIRGLQEENKQLRSQLESIRNALKFDSYDSK